MYAASPRLLGLPLPARGAVVVLASRRADAGRAAAKPPPPPRQRPASDRPPRPSASGRVLIPRLRQQPSPDRGRFVKALLPDLEERQALGLAPPQRPRAPVDVRTDLICGHQAVEHRRLEPLAAR